MLRKILVFLPCLFICFMCMAAGSIKIKGCIKNLPLSKVYLAGITGGRSTTIDSALVMNDCFDFYVNDSLPAGMYSIVLDKEHNSFIRILLNGKEDIRFSTLYGNLLDNIVFDGSVENTIYYSFLKRNKQLTEKQNLIQKLIALSEKNTPLVKNLSAELTAIAAETYSSAITIQKKYPSAIAPVFINALTPIKIPARVDTTAYLWAHYLDNVDFTSNALHHSDVLASAILNYLQFAENNKSTFTEQAENYARVLDNVLQKASKNTGIYTFYKDELTNRFMYGTYDVVGNYLSQYYPPQAPALAQGLPAIRQRFATLQAVTIGKKAPQITMPGYDGKDFTLDNISSDYTLLVFWSTNCSHCTEMLPSLKKLYDIQKNSRMEVLAISFDTDKNAWQNYLKTGNYSWINYSDLKGWNSDIAATYHVKGTPTYILLDKGKWVIGKPATLEELAHTLLTLNII